jgi:hypothetical protein
MQIPMGIAFIAIYPFELEIKYTSETTRSASYLNRHVESDREGWLITKCSEKRNDFNRPFVNLYICGNIPAAPAYGVYMFLLIRYSRAHMSVKIFG